MQGGDVVMAEENKEGESPTPHIPVDYKLNVDDPTINTLFVNTDETDFVHAAERLRNRDEETYVRLVREMAKQVENTANPSAVEAHPLARLAGAFRDLPGWEEDKAMMLKMRGKPAKL